MKYIIKTSFEDILTNLSNLYKSKKDYEISLKPNEDGSYISKNGIYKLFNLSKFDFHESFKEYKLIERTATNTFLAKYREIAKSLLKKSKLNDLDLYGIHLVYKEAVFILEFIYNILLILKQSNIDEIEFYSNGKSDSFLIIKDTSWFIIIKATIGYKEGYFYLDWKTNKDLHKEVEAIYRNYLKEWEWEWENIILKKRTESKKKSKQEKEVLEKENLVKDLSSKHPYKRIEPTESKSNKMILLYDRKYNISISFANEVYMVNLISINSGIIKSKSFESINQVSRYLEEKKISHNNIEQFKLNFR